VSPGRWWTAYTGELDLPAEPLLPGVQPPVPGEQRRDHRRGSGLGRGYIGKLTNFGTVTFQNVSINGQPLISFANQAAALTMLNDTGQEPTGINDTNAPSISQQPRCLLFGITSMDGDRQRS
jgi:hypothetical protein